MTTLQASSFSLATIASQPFPPSSCGDAPFNTFRYGTQLGAPRQFPSSSLFGTMSSSTLLRVKRTNCIKSSRLESRNKAITCSVATDLSVDYQKLNLELQNRSPLHIIDKGLEMFGDDIAIAFSGAEDVALIEYAKLTGRKFRVFSLDTGRLDPQTYAFFAQVEKHYGIKIEYTFPDTASVEKLVREKGMFSFYEDGHNECCGIRKVQPLKRMLKGLDGWITGQRRDQSPGTRANVPSVQVDPAFEGLQGGKGSLVKFNPLANVSSLEVWDFIRVQNVPINELHLQGYVSIGCQPCTRPVLPNQHEREGRWWWEDAAAKECGLHKGNLERDEQNEAQASSNGSGTISRGNAIDIFTDTSILTLSHEDMEKLAFPRAARDQSYLVVLYAPWCPYCQAMQDSFTEVAKSLSGSDIKVAKFRSDGDEKEFAKSTFGLKSFPTILFFPKQSQQFVPRISENREASSLLRWIKALE